MKPSHFPSDKQVGSLEYASYAARIGEKLKQYGWMPAENPDNSDFLVFLAYGIDGGETLSGSIPVYGQTSPATQTIGTTTTSPGGYLSYSGSTYTPATYGQVGSLPYSRRTHGRTLELKIIDVKASSRGAPVEVYQGRVHSRGSSGEISVVLPTMIEALFQDFPGLSGKTQMISSPTIRE